MKAARIVIALLLASCGHASSRTGREPSAAEFSPVDRAPTAQRTSDDGHDGKGDTRGLKAEVEGDGYFECPPPEPWETDKVQVVSSEGLKSWPDRASFPDGWEVATITATSTGLMVEFKRPECFLTAPTVSIERISGDTIVSLHGVRSDPTGRTEQRYDFHGESWFGLPKGSPKLNTYSVYKNYDETDLYLLLRGVSSDVELMFTPDLRFELNLPALTASSGGN